MRWNLCWSSFTVVICKAVYGFIDEENLEEAHLTDWIYVEASSELGSNEKWISTI